MNIKLSKILQDVYKIKHPNKKFRAGETYIPTSGQCLDTKEAMALIDFVLENTPIAEGRYTEQFEKELSRYLGVRCTAVCNSGSSANLLAIMALTSPKLGNRALKPGDEVITTAVGFPTTINPILQAGCVPVFVDVSLSTYNTTPHMVSDAITEKTKAIFIAHTLGNPYDVQSIKDLAEDNGLWLIEDCADALGAEFEGRKVGTFGHIATTSFYPAHMITTVEGGAVFTNTPLLDKIIRSFRDWGRDCFPAGTKIDTDNGVKNIEDVNVGDYVLSHIGEYRKVLELTGKIDNNLLTLKPRTMKKITSTSNHPYFVKRKGSKKLEWVRADDLSIGDYVTESIPQYDKSLDIKDFYFSYENLYNTVNESLPIEPNLLRLVGYWLAEGSVASGLKGGSGYTENKYKFYRVDFAFNKNEVQTIEDVSNLMDYYFGVSCSIRYKGNGAMLSFKSRKGFEFFTQFFGKGATQKSLPTDIINLDLGVGLSEIIRGYWIGDGSSSSQGFSICSTSETLINQIRRLLLRFQIVGSFHKRKPENHTPSIVNGKKIQAKNILHSIDFYGENAEKFGSLIGEKFIQNNKRESKVLFDKLYVYYPIEYIEKEKLEIPIRVYNFEVDIDHSYHANGLAVHNCWCLPGKDNTCGKRFGWKDMGDLPDGFDHKYIYTHIGYNLKMTDLQASMGLEQLKKLSTFLEKRRNNWNLLHELLSENKLVQESFLLPQHHKDANPAWFGFVITLKDGVSFTRSEFAQYLEQNKIGSRNIFAGNITKQPAYIDKGRIHDFLFKSDIVMKNSLWIGVHPSINENMIDYTVKTIIGFLEMKNETP